MTPAQALGQSAGTPTNPQRCQGLSIEDFDIFAQRGGDILKDNELVRPGDELHMSGYLRNTGFRLEKEGTDIKDGYLLENSRINGGAGNEQNISWPNKTRPSTIPRGKSVYFSAKDTVTEADAKHGLIVRSFEFPIATSPGGEEVCSAHINFQASVEPLPSDQPTKPLAPGGIVGIVTGALSALGAIGSILWLALKAIFR